MIEPHATLDEVRALLADADVTSLVAELPRGRLTPVAAMAALGTDASCFLLESVEGSGKVARWSLRARLDAAPADPSAAPAGDGVEAAAAEAQANLSREAFERAVARCLDYIVAGDIFQVQLSRRFAVPFIGRPFDLYRAIRDINPSPYMFYVATPDCTLVGASPEMLVRVTGRRIQYHPIAGTRRRGRTAEDDARMEAQLRSSEKE